jgi:ribonuclease P protein component
MLKKQFRLANFRLNNPKIISTDFFTVKISSNTQQFNRFGFVVSKKFSKSAVKRNAVKRKIRSCIEEIFDNIVVGNDFIIYPKLSAENTEKSKILKVIQDSLKKESLL